MSSMPGLSHSDVPDELHSLQHSDPENNKCFECSAVHPSWASVILGIYICLNCSGKHRGLGTHLSTVRSLTLDNWNPKQIAFMRYGGNTRAREALASVADITDIRTKYESKEATLYRIQLKKEVYVALSLPLENTESTSESSGLNTRRLPSATSISSDQYFADHPDPDNYRPPSRRDDKNCCPCNIL